MNVTDSEQRRNSILEVIVEAYVQTAMPVGSEWISQKLRPSLSSATIRNIMVELEKEGLLEQPHTSAGRVPTDLGYRRYVDAVMEVGRIAREQIEQLKKTIEPDEFDAAQLFERASEALAELSQQATFVVTPTVKRSTVKQVELVPLSVRKLLCVMIANEEIVASHVIEVTEPMSRDEATALARFINTELVGVPFQALLDSLERRLLAEQDTVYHVIRRSLDVLQHALSTEPEERLIVDGASYLIAQPEFVRAPRKAHDILKRMEQHQDLLDCIRRDISRDGVRVRIGREVKFPGLDECSFVTAPFAIGEELAGGIGVVGPTRMDYRHVQACVEATAKAITDVLTRWMV